MARAVVPLAGNVSPGTARSRRAAARALWIEGADVSCPHCSTLLAPIDHCCVCNGRHVVPASRAIAAVRNVWARDGCECQACAVLVQIERAALG